MGLEPGAPEPEVLRRVGAMRAPEHLPAAIQCAVQSLEWYRDCKRLAEDDGGIRVLREVQRLLHGGAVFVVDATEVSACATAHSRDALEWPYAVGGGGG